MNLVKKPVLISIIIPTLNEERFLPKLLKNLEKQKEKNFEVLVIDGKSTDQTKRVALGFKDKLQLSFIEADQRGLAHQRNYAAKLALGKYLVFLDADLGVFADFTKKLEHLFKTHPALVYIPSNIPDEKNLEARAFFQLATLVVEFSQFIGRPIATGGSMVVEKSFFNLIGGFPEDVALSEDHQFVQKVYDWGVKSMLLTKLKVKFSLRRLRREGRLKTFVKTIRLYAHYMVKGKITNDIVGYPMGGHLYGDKEFKLNKQKRNILFDSSKILKDSKRLLKKLMTE
jgi:glycosyltransferase involved in cell wall biosynthesis